MKTLALGLSPDNQRVYFRWISVCALILTALFCRAENKTDLEEPQTLLQQKQKELINSTHVIGFADNKSEKDSIEALLNMFYMDQFRHFQDPRAPYFMFMSKDGKLAMGLGGLIRMRGYYDWDGSIPANGFSPYAIPIPKDPTSMKRLFATPAGTFEDFAHSLVLYAPSSDFVVSYFTPLNSNSTLYLCSGSTPLNS